MKIRNCTHALSLKHLDELLYEIPVVVLKNEDIQILTSNKIYNDVKHYLIDGKYKGVSIFPFSDISKDKGYPSLNRYHN